MEMATLAVASWNQILGCLQQFNLLKGFAAPHTQGMQTGASQEAAGGSPRHSLPAMESAR